MGEAGAGWLRVGTVGRAHGLDGSFHVIGASPDLLAVGMGLRLSHPGGGTRTMTIDRRGGTEARVRLHLSGVDSREAAEALRGAELQIAREQAPALDEDEWWAEDLEGCLVVDGETTVGTVRRLSALPSCEILEVQRPDGSELLVPLVGDAVRAVDIEARLIDVDLVFLGES